MLESSFEAQCRSQGLSERDLGWLEAHLELAGHGAAQCHGLKVVSASDRAEAIALYLSEQLHWRSPQQLGGCSAAQLLQGCVDWSLLWERLEAAAGVLCVAGPVPQQGSRPWFAVLSIAPSAEPQPAPDLGQLQDGLEPATEELPLSDAEQHRFDGLGYPDADYAISDEEWQKFQAMRRALGRSSAGP